MNSSNSLQTQYTYDPFGNVTTSGQASSYPYLFGGMEYDGTGLYFTGSGYYSPALGRPLQQVDPLGNSGGDGSMRSGSSLPSSSGGGGLGGLAGTVANNAADLGISGAAGGLGGLAEAALFGSEGGPVGVVIAVAVDVVLQILDDFFGFDLFGGGSQPSSQSHIAAIPTTRPGIYFRTATLII